MRLPARAWSAPGGRAPHANVGLRTGPESGLFVLDVDADKGGYGTVQRLGQQHGPLPPTPVSLTGGGGEHILFAYPTSLDLRNSAEKLGPGIDTRGAGGYIVAPPSLHISGRRYEWDAGAHPDDVPLAAAPAWLLELLTAAPPERKGRAPAAAISDIIGEGQRNATLTSLAGSMRRRGMTEDEIADSLLIINARRVVPPLPEADIRKIARSVGRYAPAVTPASAPVAPFLKKGEDESGAPPGAAAAMDGAAPPPGTALTDLGNAERFIRQHGENVRYVPRWGKWLYWDGRRWRNDDTNYVRGLAIETVRSIYAEAAAADDDAERKALAKHAFRSESDNKVKAALSLAQALPGVAVAPEIFDTDPWLLNCENGTLDLRTGDLRPHRREDYITKLCPVVYDDTAEAPTWERFLARVMDGNQELIAFLQRAAGYSLTGLTSEECLFFCYGTGRNGKSKFLGAIEYILGDYAKPTKPDVFMEKRSQGGPSNDLADLAGARFVPTIETGEGGRLAEGLLKWLTGSDKVKARFLFNENFTFRPQFKLWLAGNHKPVIRGSDEGIWSRIKLIPFTVTIPTAERDRDLGAKLEAEAAGILRWAVDGCIAWTIHRLGEPEEVRTATQEYREEMDILAGFLDDCCLVRDDIKATAKALYERYEQWAKDNGMTPASSTWFGRKLGERGFKRTKSNGIIWWNGIALTVSWGQGQGE